MKKFRLIFVFFLFSCASKNEVFIISSGKEKTLNILTINFNGNNKNVYYNSDHFSFPCISKYEKQIKYNKQEFNRMIKSEDKTDLVFVENEKHEFKDIEKFLPYDENNYKIHLDIGSHCRGLEKIYLSKGEVYDTKIMIDKHFLKINEDDTKIRLHFIHKDSLTDFHTISNWFQIIE